MPPRIATINRKTNETKVSVRLNLDGSGKAKINTELPFLDHMLEQVAAHGLLDLELQAKGDLEVDAHHTVEDTAIAFGDALRKALGDLKGINRYGEATMPMDEALTMVAIDFSSRTHLTWKVDMPRSSVGNIETELFKEWFEALSRSGMMTLHVWNFYGTNSHHIIESCFKGLGRALLNAVAVDKRRTSAPSTKGVL